MSKSIYETLSTIDVSTKTKSIQGNVYLPWSQAWGLVCKAYPDATYEVIKDENGYPYKSTPLGIFVEVSVTINNITHSVVRPVYDFRNLGMKEVPYELKYGKKTVTVNGATSNDINDSLMRCLVKAIAFFGLGINLYKGEQYAELELINSKELSEISNLIAKHNLDLGALNAVFRINRLSELASFNFESALAWIENNKIKGN